MNEMKLSGEKRKMKKEKNEYMKLRKEWYGSSSQSRVKGGLSLKIKKLTYSSVLQSHKVLME